MKPRILLINPPIYDFTAYDFWLKPLGMLTVAGRLKPFADMTLYDYLDRLHPSSKTPSDQFKRGRYPSQIIPKPPQFAQIPRYYRRFGLQRSLFQRFLAENGGFDIALIQTVMTYWYPGIQEVIEDLRKFCPDTTIVLGGFYAQACPDHARSLGADIVISTTDLSPLYDKLAIPLSERRTPIPPFWQGYDRLESAAIKLSNGCPFKCTYCWSGQHGPEFAPKPVSDCIAELQLLLNTGVTDIAFYDDALLYQPEKAFLPFLQHIIDDKITVNLHTPNALHAGLVTAELAELMVRAGFKTFYLGFESSSDDFQKQTGSKVSAHQLKTAVDHLVNAGANRSYITAYEIIGHPQSDLQQLEESMRLANSLGIAVMLSDFSPIPGTPDGEQCRRWVDLDEPLNHNKTAFPITLLGADEVNRLKDLRHKLNRNLR